MTKKYFFTGYEQEHKLLPEEKQAVPYVMEAIELLFVAWFMEQNDTKCAEDAMKIYCFVERKVERILMIVGDNLEKIGDKRILKYRQI